MRHGVWLANGKGPSVTETVEHAVVAEDAGWDGVFVSDSIWDGFSDPWTVLGAIASRTDRIRLATWVTPIPHQLPWRLAHALATLDQLSGGRMILGAGLGTRHDHEMFGGSYDAARLGRRYDETLEVVTALWRGGPVSFDGEFFTLRDATLPILPVQRPRIPILIGCWWPNRRPFRRAARWDGLMPNWPAMLGEEPGPEGQPPSGRPLAEELEELLAFYHSLTDEPGEIVVPGVADPDYLDVCRRYAVTWFIHGGVDPERLRAGPPSWTSLTDEASRTRS